MRNQPGHQGKAEGELQVGEQRALLTYAYAYQTDQGEDLYEMDRGRLTLILSERALSLKGIESSFTRSGLVRAGKLRAVEIEVKPGKPAELSGRLLWPQERPDAFPMSFTAQNQEDHRFTELKVTRTQISGTVALSQPQEIPTFEETTPKKTYQYKVRFVAPITRAPAITAKLTGKMALASPILAAVLQGFTVLKKGDLAAVKRQLGPDQVASLETLLATPEGRKQFETMRKETPEPTALRKNLKVILVRGDTATVIFQEKGGTLSARAARLQGRWQAVAE